MGKSQRCLIKRGGEESELQRIGSEVGNGKRGLVIVLMLVYSVEI